MNGFQRILNWFKRPAGITLVVVLIAAILLVIFSYRLTLQGSLTSPTPTSVANAAPTAPPTPTIEPTATTEPTPTPIVLPPQDSSRILGVDNSVTPDSDKQFPGINWFRLSHPSCGWGDLQGQKLKDAIQHYHQKDIRVLFVICQASNRDVNDIKFDEIAQAYPDAVQCGNEQMKQDASVAFLYSPPDKYADFYHRCEGAIRKVNPKAHVLMGSLDPHVAGPDYAKMVGQVSYLDQMQSTMNALRPGSNWEWRRQAIGVIDSWYNGYRGANNLAGIFDFWAQQFRVDRNNGDLGKHLWVVEGTACWKGCGVDQYNPYEVAVVHVLGLITDIQTSMAAKVPFFHFSGKDFQTTLYEPTGLLDLHGRPKPLRQDLGMGDRKLTLSCPNGGREVQDQLQLTIRLYGGCTLPGNYVAILTS